MYANAKTFKPISERQLGATTLPPSPDSVLKSLLAENDHLVEELGKSLYLLTQRLGFVLDDVPSSLSDCETNKPVRDSLRNSLAEHRSKLAQCITQIADINAGLII